MHAAGLRYFTVVAKSGSIRKASEELHVASSAISRQIQKIEDDLGVSLFDRLPAGLRLTEHGRAVLEHAERTLNDYELLKADLGALQGMMTGVVRIACLDSLLVNFMPHQIARFHAAHPRVEYRVRSAAHGRIAAMLAEGEFDIGVTFNLARPDDLDFICDVPMPLMAMVAHDHPLAGMESVTLNDCAQFNLLLQLDTEPIRSLIEVELSVLERTGRLLLASNNLMMLKPMIMSGAGVAFYTPVGLADEVTDGSIVSVPLRGTRLDALRMGILVPRRRKLSQATRAMVDQIAEALQSVVPDNA